MKSKMTITLFVISLSLFSFIGVQQNTRTVVASYDGFEYEMYSFIIPATEDSGIDEYVVFSDISEDILKEFDFKSDALIGLDFEITFKIEGEEIEDDEIEDDEIEEGQMAEEVNILISVKKASKKK